MPNKGAGPRRWNDTSPIQRSGTMRRIPRPRSISATTGNRIELAITQCARIERRPSSRRDVELIDYVLDATRAPRGARWRQDIDPFGAVFANEMVLGADLRTKDAGSPKDLARVAWRDICTAGVVNPKELHMRAQDLMTQPIATCHVNDTLNVAAREMWDHDCGAIAITGDDGKLAGMITDRDICMAASARPAARRDPRQRHHVTAPDLGAPRSQARRDRTADGSTPDSPNPRDRCRRQAGRNDRAERHRDREHASRHQDQERARESGAPPRHDLQAARGETKGGVVMANPLG